MDNNGQQETAALVVLALDNFRKDTVYREQPGTRSGRRTMQIIRFGMTGLSVPGLIPFYPVFTLTTDFSRITRT